VTGQPVTFAIYWRPGRALVLVTNHPGTGAVQGAQTMQFRFPSGEAMAFATTRSGNQLQTNIGFGGAAQRFYTALRANPSLRIELPGVNDIVEVSLAEREQVISAMLHCRDDYLHGG
jgi:hypothetical protein